MRTLLSLPKACLLVCALSAAPAAAATFEFDQDDFDTVTPLFSGVSTFEFRFTITEPLVAGGTYSNPAMGLMDYRVRGTLAAGTPSGFPAFDLRRPDTEGESFPGTEFYAQGSSLSFSILSTANLSDGLQLSEIDGTFTLNALEINTGRYHPPILTLSNDGTGLLQNSNNNGATVTNPATGQLVSVLAGEEYRTGLTTDPAAFTLAAAPVNAVVPLPPTIVLLGSVFAGLGALRARRRRAPAG